MKFGVFEQMEGGELRLLYKVDSFFEAVKKASELNSSALDSTFVGGLYYEELYNIFNFPEDEL